MIIRVGSKIIVAACLAALCAGISACSVAESIPYPRLATVGKLKDKVLSNEEQEAAIKDLSMEQKDHQSAAIKEIEKRQ